MKLSYLVTCHNEDKTLESLLSNLSLFTCGQDEIVILDDFSTNPETQKIIGSYTNEPRFKINQHKLDNNYGEHKNYGNSLCSGEFIFQLDGDECPKPDLICNIKDIIKSNPDVELFFVPRINDFKGVTEAHAKQWGWRLDMSPTYKRLRVNFPDFQGRIYKNDPKIKWDRRLHEKIEGHNKYSFLPAEEEYALYHDKTIEKQIETNVRYNKLFTQEENQGYVVK